MNRLNIFGAGGHAAVVIETALASGFVIDQIVDQDESINTCLDYPVSHEFLKAENDLAAEWFIAIGSNKVRKAISQQLQLQYATLVHPTAVVSPSSQFGEGSLIMPGVVINARATIGKQVILNTRCSIDHDCFLEDFVHISPGVALAGNVWVGEGTHIGIGAVVIPGVKIGKWSTIGAGTVVLKDVPDGAVVVGNPGRMI